MMSSGAIPFSVQKASAVPSSPEKPLQNLPIGRDSGGVERKGHDGIPRNC
jgi:hypothetical protein